MKPAFRPSRTASEKTVGRIPVTLLTGFLGAGKTTLLNNLVRQPEMSGAAVLINEFGEVGIDHHLVDMVDESLVILDSGCLCCAMQGDLVNTLKNLSAKSSRREIPPITRVLIETTGLADPVPIVYTLLEHTFVAARYVCDGVITVVDALIGEKQLGQHQEAVRQASMADRLLITKCDIADRRTRASLSERLSTLNPSAVQIEISGGQVSADQVLGLGLYALEGKSPDVAAWLGELAPPKAPEGSAIANSPWIPHQPADPHASAHPRHDERVRSFVIELDQPVRWLGFSATMGQILMEYGPRLLRVKGLVAVAGSEDVPMVVHAVEGVAYPPLRLAQWPSDSQFADRRGRLVMIGFDISLAEEAEIRAALAHIPGATSAARIVAANPLLPTRCWLTHRQAPALNSTLQIDGWVVQAKRLSKTTGDK